MASSNSKKAQVLGMSGGKARNILTKNILFAFAQRLNLDTCYRCSKKIEMVKEFSIEHKIAWQNSDKPIKLFFDLNNISFSHLSCNCKDASRNKVISEEHKKKISEANKGRKMSSQKYAKMITTVNRICKTPEFKLKVSNAMREWHRKRKLNLVVS